MLGCCLLQIHKPNSLCRAARDLLEIFLGQLDLGLFPLLDGAARRTLFLQAYITSSAIAASFVDVEVC